jgi:hypothetical protein
MEPLRSRLPGARPTVVALVVAALAARAGRPALADALAPNKTAAAAVRLRRGDPPREEGLSA